MSFTTSMFSQPEPKTYIGVEEMIELLKKHLGPRLRKYKETSEEEFKQNVDFYGRDCEDTLSDQTYKEDTLAALINTEKILSCLQPYAVFLNQKSPDFHHNHISDADEMDVPHNLERRSVLANTETILKLLQSFSADANGLLSTFKATNDALKGNTVVIGDILEYISDLKSDLKGVSSEYSAGYEGDNRRRYGNSQ
ncbi:uncharacterized protein H6S33_004121 [Morchella sextelata]|uniref:uncharacterized protein n=1 Tax=Morchella sextelata TaxID=1174677 RepID=UPI001D040C41|nr:uncharacterized protein H6S33_004121 [Morchella sextelata]KAH0606460.1 hypothetical protein H6S33_004121 [Morchella sextelata]